MRGNKRSPAHGRKAQDERLNNRKRANSMMCIWREACREKSGPVPSICFCSCRGAAASMVVVSGSCPWTTTAGCGAGAEKSIIRNAGSHIFVLRRSRLYLLHGDLRLSVDVLLGVAYSCGILVLGHPPYRIGCYGGSGGGRSGAHGLGGCGSRLTDKRLANYRNCGATFVTYVFRDQRRHIFFRRATGSACGWITRGGQVEVRTYRHAGWLSCEAAARKAAWNRTSEGAAPRSAWHFACFGNLKPTREPFTVTNFGFPYHPVQVK